jgi:hypothetical protein
VGVAGGAAAAGGGAGGGGGRPAAPHIAALGPCVALRAVRRVV